MPEAANSTVPPRTKIRTRPDPSPISLSTLLNQTESPAGMAVPLKFDVIELLPGGGPCNSANGFMAVGLCRLANCIDGTIGALLSSEPGAENGFSPRAKGLKCAVAFGVNTVLGSRDQCSREVFADFLLPCVPKRVEAGWPGASRLLARFRP